MLQRHLEEYHSRGYLGAGPSERLHGGLAPFNTLVWPVSDSTRLRVALNRAQKDIDLASALPLSSKVRWLDSTSIPVDVAIDPEQVSNSKFEATSRGALQSRTQVSIEQLRLGFISSDFGDHPVGWAFLPWLLELRERKRLRLICFAMDIPEKRHAGTELRRQIASVAHEFYDVTLVSDAEAARMINDVGVHVLINLVGHTAGARHTITQYSPAPIQTSFYGYAGTTALPRMQYLQVDSTAVPPRYHSDYTERMAYFPHSHFIAVHARRFAHTPSASRHAHPWAASSADRRAESQNGRLTFSRRDLGLQLSERRLHGVALCNFNQLYKLDPESWHAWGNALRRLPDASLWLSRVTVRKDSSAFAERRLRAEAAAAGIANRLGFAWKMPVEDFLSIRALADLMVDNRWYNAHTTGADTLWSGVPAITLQGRNLASRASSSFMHALGFGHMVAPSWKAYEDAIVSAAATPARLQCMRRHLLDARHTAPFFDLSQLAKAQERLANAMWMVHSASNHTGALSMHVIIAR